MSQLRPDEEDEAFAQGHNDAGFRKALCRIKRLEDLLKRALAEDDLEGGVSMGGSRSMLGADIAAALTKTFYDEEDDGHWRLPK
jgi:hypothetical protein